MNFRILFSPKTLLLCAVVAMYRRPASANPITDFTVIFLADLAADGIKGPGGSALGLCLALQGAMVLLNNLGKPRVEALHGSDVGGILAAA
jgi:hypothetical protein